MRDSGENGCMANPKMENVLNLALAATPEELERSEICIWSAPYPPLTSVPIITSHFPHAFTKYKPGRAYASLYYFSRITVPSDIQKTLSKEILPSINSSKPVHVIIVCILLMLSNK